MHGKCRKKVINTKKKHENDDEIKEMWLKWNWSKIVYKQYKNKPSECAGNNTDNWNNSTNL